MTCKQTAKRIETNFFVFLIVKNFYFFIFVAVVNEISVWVCAYEIALENIIIQYYPIGNKMTKHEFDLNENRKKELNDLIVYYSINVFAEIYADKFLLVVIWKCVFFGYRVANWKDEILVFLYSLNWKIFNNT